MLHQRYSNAVTSLHDKAIKCYTNARAMLRQFYVTMSWEISQIQLQFMLKNRKRDRKNTGKREKHQWYNKVATILYDNATKCYINATTMLWQCYNKPECWKEGQRQRHLKISWSAFFFSSDAAVRDKRITECDVFQLWLWPWRDLTELCTFDFTILTNQRKTLFNEFRLDLQVNKNNKLQI